MQTEGSADAEGDGELHEEKVRMHGCKEVVVKGGVGHASERKIKDGSDEGGGGRSQGLPHVQALLLDNTIRLTSSDLRLRFRVDLCQKLYRGRLSTWNARRTQEDYIPIFWQQSPYRSQNVVNVFFHIDVIL